MFMLVEGLEFGGAALGSRTPDLRITRDPDNDDQAYWQQKQVAVGRSELHHRQQMAPIRSPAWLPDRDRLPRFEITN